MSKKELGFVDYVGIIVSVFAGFISVLAQYNDPQTSFILFFALIGFILLYFLFSWPIDFFRRKFRIIDFNKNNIETIRKDLNNIRERLDLKEEISDLSARVSLIEKSRMNNKKGQIDPRWIIIIIIIILLILFLRSKGII